MTTLDEMMGQLRKRLTAAGLDDPMAEARILVSGIMGLTRTDFLVRGKDQIPNDAETALEAAVARRVGGEPVYRILGKRGFYGLELRISKDTLDPRPDTEVLVDLVLELLSARRGDPLEILDLGIGTGAICLALLSQLPGAKGIGVDLAEGALATATENAALNGLGGRFSAVRSNWFDDVAGLYDVVVSNPPYIRSDIVPTLDREVREHDPILALDGGTDGLDAYRAIANGVGRYLKAYGIVAVETGFDQKHAVSNRLRRRKTSQAMTVRRHSG
jgi:release factor glutamine methyltransferase